MDDASKLLNLEGIEVYDSKGNRLELVSAYVSLGLLVVTVMDYHDEMEA